MDNENTQVQSSSEDENLISIFDKLSFYFKTFDSDRHVECTDESIAKSCGCSPSSVKRYRKVNNIPTWNIRIIQQVLYLQCKLLIAKGNYELADNLAKYHKKSANHFFWFAVSFPIINLIVLGICKLLGV